MAAGGTGLTEAEVRRRGIIPGAVLMPHTDVRERLGELPRDRPVYA